MYLPIVGGAKGGASLRGKMACAAACRFKGALHRKKARTAVRSGESRRSCMVRHSPTSREPASSSDAPPEVVAQVGP